MRRPGRYGIAAIAVIVTGAGVPAAAQSSDEAAGGTIEEIITIGSRVPGRSATDTPVAIDVIPTELIERNGFIETGRMIQQLVPSFNFGTNNISDGSDIARPATLRGLGPDQVLVLVNGKRHVGQAWLNIGDSFGRGSTGVDINSIPTHAIARIEVLRDGASSQYGSDAIAGVINIVTKTASEGGEVRALWGQTYEGDGSSYTVAVNQGFALGDGGFLNITGERREKNPTNRADVSNRTFTAPGAEPTAGKRIFRVGDSEAEDWSVLANAMVPLGEGFEAWATGKYNNRDGESTGFYRHPFQADRSVPQVFPSGFLPFQTTDIEDLFAMGGVRFEGDGGWRTEASVNYGENSFGFGARNTINASIAAEFLANNPGATDAEIAANAGPTEGKSGKATIKQTVVNVDLSGPLDLGLENPVYLAAGFEYRDESYGLKAGDRASFSCGSQAGPAAFPSVVDPSVTANCGFQAFPGYSPAVEGAIGRDNFALYLDLEHNVTERWLLTGALRYEDYSSVGDKLTGKVATRFEASDALSLRGSFSTGFRAPSLPQIGFTSTVTQAGPGGLAQTLIARLADPFTQSLGIDQLKFETSRNFSLGFVATPLPDVSLTVDFYRIAIDDRIVLSESLSQGLLTAQGLDGPAAILAGRDIDQAAVFFNAIDTKTNGVDIVATHNADIGGGHLSTTLAATWNETNIKKFRAPGGIDPLEFFGPESRGFVEDIQPNVRATLTLDYEYEKFNALFRTNYFGSTESRFFTAETIFGCPPDTACGPVAPFGLDPSSTQKVSSAFIFDLEFSYDFTEQFRLAAGANNILDKKPNRIADNAVIRWISDGGGFGGPPNASFGNFKFPVRGVPYGTNGGFYYFRASFRY
ncbi:MAG: TonB-dependent receptor [Rhodothalassiaceae bacterium]